MAAHGEIKYDIHIAALVVHLRRSGRVDGQSGSRLIVMVVVVVPYLSHHQTPQHQPTNNDHTRDLLSPGTTTCVKTRSDNKCS